MFSKRCIFFITLFTLIRVVAVAQQHRLNVLFIAVDDLRPELGCYGNDIIKTPNIDRLASMGAVFDRAYCQQAVCSPSRTSLLTGLRPDQTKVYDLATHFRSTIPDVITLPQYFKNHGYYTKGLGKIYHGALDDPLSWSGEERASQAKKGQLGKPGNSLAKGDGKTNNNKANSIKDIIAANQAHSRNVRNRIANSFPYSKKDVADNAYGDGKVAEEAIQVLRDRKNNSQPFFLAVGFRKPHLPFVAPKKYWDWYDPDKIPVADNAFPPKNVPEIALTNWSELRVYKGVPKTGDLPAEQAKVLKQGYYACVSYIDAQVGKLLDELKVLDLLKNTIIILWGDHGWKLGEHNMWCKHTNFEIDTRVPLICYTPQQSSRGSKIEGLVEFIDIYPSLCELAGIPLPGFKLPGKSFAPLMNHPGQSWKDAAYSQFPRQNGIMGYTMRTDGYRFTQWLDKAHKVIATELYDHTKDPEENENISGYQENKGLIAKLSQQMEQDIGLKK